MREEDKTVKNLLKDIKKLKCVNCKSTYIKLNTNYQWFLETQRWYICEECWCENIINHSQEYLDSYNEDDF
jgi:RNase P subunit RPR2